MAPESFSGSEVPSGLSGESKEKEVRFGRGVNILASFRRHGIPEKDPTSGMSLDRLTQEGIRQARGIGSTIDTFGGVKVYASGKVRAQQTASEIASGVVERGAKIINKRIEGDQGEFIVREKKDLETINMGPEAKRLMKEEGLTGFVKEWITRGDLGDGTTTREIAAAHLAARLDVYARMAPHLKSNSSVRLENITHGPNPDALLAEIADVRDKENCPMEGWGKIEALGGVFQPGDAMEISIHNNQDGKQEPMVLRMRGQEIPVDVKRFAQLVELSKTLKEQ